MIIQTNQQLNNCHDFADAGLCLVPLRLDGSKAPSIPRWKQLQNRKPADAEIDNWFARPAGVAVVCGQVSGGLEVLDFDHDAEYVFANWSAMVEPILCCLPVVETPSGGFHVYYRCYEYCNNQKLALSENKNVLIETRGEGGYVVTVMSPPEVHRLNYEYIQVGGPVLPDVPTIRPEQRKALWKAALSFDRSGILKSRQGAIVPRPQQLRFSSKRVESARQYVAKMDPAISGRGGHNQTYKVACKLIQKFGLPQDQALSLLMEWNEQCQPPWTRRELEHKIREANK